MEELRPARLALYEGAPQLLGVVAKGYGLELSAQSSANLVRASVLMGLLDHVVDRGTVDERGEVLGYWRATYSANVPSAPPSTGDSRLAGVAESLRVDITDDQAQLFYSAGSRAISLADRYRSSQNIKEYAALTLLEGRAAADMFDAVVCPEDKQLPGYAAYVRAVKVLGGVSNLIDSVYDLPRDYARAETAIRPTMVNRLRLASLALPDTLLAMRYAGPHLPLLVGASGLAAITAWRQRRQDRRELGPVSLTPRTHDC